MTDNKIDTYKLVVILRFCAAHKIDNYAGKCANLHWHNYKAEIEVTAYQLDSVGFAIDSETIKYHAKEVITKLDHCNLNELSEFSNTPTSAENIAKYIYEQCSQRLNSDVIRVSSITLWEINNFYVRYEQMTAIDR